MSLPVAVGVGLLLGARHAIDADHIVAITTMLGRERGFSSAIRTSVLWGLGHSVTFLGIGVSIVALGLRVPASFERAADMAVAAMLVALGAAHVYRSLRFDHNPVGGRGDHVPPRVWRGHSARHGCINRGLVVAARVIGARGAPGADGYWHSCRRREPRARHLSGDQGYHG